MQSGGPLPTARRLHDDFDILVERDEKAEQAFDQLELFWDDPTSEP